MRCFSEMENHRGPTDSLEYKQMDNILRIFKEKLIVWPSRKCNNLCVIAKVGFKKFDPRIGYKKSLHIGTLYLYKIK